MAVSIATNSGTLVSAFLIGMGGLDSAVMYLTSLAITGYGFIKSIDFNQSNKLFWSGIEDTLDKEAFQKVVVPLYQAITTNIFDDVFPLARDEVCTNKKSFLEKYEAHKQTKLKTVDFTFLSESINFQSAITEIIDSRKNYSEFVRLKKSCRIWIMGMTGMGFLSLITLIGSTVTSTIVLLPSLSNILFASYGVSIVITISLGIIYWINKTRLDNLT